VRAVGRVPSRGATWNSNRQKFITISCDGFAFLERVSAAKLFNEHMSRDKRIPTGDGQAFSNNPFDSLSSEGLPAAAPLSLPGTELPTKAAPVRKSRGRVDIIRQKAGRGGKTVTVVKNFVGIGLPEKEQLAKKMKACGTGGTVKNGQIEIQGDKRAEVAEILREAGFRPVFAGG
jgi:translation initiation factor 1